ncbi:MAG: ferrous iron transporter B [Candidatus Altiarchaeota archaeon]|nr:ferrous iron transporter B [Candidatus Altiarchaeota archaeon]
MQILLMGNPNVGKSALFSRLTGVDVTCSNYPGTTVGFCSGKLRHGGLDAQVIDVPGTYSLQPTSPVEDVAKKMLEEGDVVVDVIDATNLERNLHLALQIIDSGKKTVIALNMMDDTRHLGIDVDVEKLEKIIGVPVVSTVAVTGEGVKELVEKLHSAKSNKKNRSEDERFRQAGHIVGKVQKITEKKHTFMEHLEDASIQPLTGFPIAAALLFVMSLILLKSGELFIAYILDPFFYGIYHPLVSTAVKTLFGDGLAYELLVGSGADMVSSLGALTAGIYVPFAMILPYVALFYLFLGLLEDSGYLPRLATLMDNLMHRVGLHGMGVIPVVLGMGCRVPGILSTRMLETGKQRFIAAVLISICIPCLAQNAVVIGLLLPHGLKYVAVVYVTLTTLYLLIGAFLKRFIPGDSPEIIMEIPPYRVPNSYQLLKKTWMRVRYFLTEAVPYIIGGVFAVNIMYKLGVVDYITHVFGPALSILFGLPQEAIIALLVGFLRKDFAVGMLAPIAMTPMQLAVATTLLVTYAPCLATLTVLYRELGLGDFLKFLALMTLVTVATGVAMKAVFL